MSVAFGVLLVVSAPAALAESQGHVANRGSKAVRTDPAPAFNWFANGSSATVDDAAIARTKAAILKAKALHKGATWVCSPAGSGRGSVCQQG